MNQEAILFTSSIYPYPTLPNDTSLTDATGARFTRGDGMFGMISHSHHFANHILAQNIEAPSVILEYPRWDDFVAEVAKGYKVIGISALPVHLDGVLRMCRHVREHSPGTKILLGCYAGMALAGTREESDWRQYVDEICHGEGVAFLRKYLGEDPARPIQQKLMPKGGGSPPLITKFPRGAIGFLVSGLGCPGRCEFCSSTAMFDHKRIELVPPETLVDDMYLYYKRFPNLSNVFVVEEDHFRWPDYVVGVREAWEKHPDMVEQLDWFAFGSLDNIGAFVGKYGWDAIVEAGIGVMFIGVETKFGDLLKYKKRSEVDPKWVFSNLHQRGVRTVGSWICGWDFHTPANVMEDLNYFVALKPTYQQLTRLSPFPGTPLWERVKQEGRLANVPWEEMHFWSEGQKHPALQDHETLNIVEYGYDLLYRTWGPSLLRRLEVELDGYAFCRQSSNPVLRDHKSVFFRKQCGMLWALLGAIGRYAPNGMVRHRVRMVDRKYRSVVGEPTAVMELLSKAVLWLSRREHAKVMADPSFYRAKEEPFKRYVYDKPAAGNGDVPYRTEWPTKPSGAVRRQMAGESVRYFFLEKALKARRLATPGKGDAIIDDYLVGMVSDRAFGFGL